MMYIFWLSSERNNRKNCTIQATSINNNFGSRNSEGNFTRIMFEAQSLDCQLDVMEDMQIGSRDYYTCNLR